jgi:hypothetical protein
MSIGIGLCVNQTRAVLEALFGHETEFVRTPKHGIRGKLENWKANRYRAAKSITPFIEVAMALYFVIAIGVAVDHGHYLSLPFLGLFLCGFGYVGCVSLWQGSVGAAIRNAFGSRARGRAVQVVPPAPYAFLAQRASDSMVGEIVVPEGEQPRLPASENAV